MKMLLLLPLLTTVTLPVEGIEGALIRIGAAAAASTAVWLGWGRPIQHWFKSRAEVQEQRLRNIEKQVTTNGSRKLLPSEDQELPLADLVVHHIVRSEPLIRKFIEEHPDDPDIAGTSVTGRDWL